MFLGWERNLSAETKPHVDNRGQAWSECPYAASCTFFSFLGKDLCGGLISLKKGGKSWGLMTCLFSGKDQPWWDKQGAEGKRSSSSSEECVGQLYDSV